MPSVMLSIRFVFEMKFYRTSARISSMVIRSWACHLSTTISSYRFKALTTAHIVRIDTEWWTNIDQGSKWTEARFSDKETEFLGRFNEGRQKVYVIVDAAWIYEPKKFCGDEGFNDDSSSDAWTGKFFVSYCITNLPCHSLLTTCYRSVALKQTNSFQNILIVLFHRNRKRKRRRKECEKKPSKPSTFHR